MTEETRTATRSGHERVLALTESLVRRKSADARRNARRREILVLHEGDHDPLQRMLNAIEPGSYIRPHRHVEPPKAEGLVVLMGSVGFVTFDDSGAPEPDSFVLLSRPAGVLGVDYRAGLWHTFFALESGTVVYEVKPGPYDSETDKEFAPWAPEEGADASVAYLERLEAEFRTAMCLD
jgi:cupin fold WbuC family metalloprotein